MVSGFVRVKDQGKRACMFIHLRDVLRQRNIKNVRLHYEIKFYKDHINMVYEAGVLNMHARFP